MDLSIIIPCKNEAPNIALCVERVAASCPDAEILVLDSGLDDTKAIVEQLKTAVPHLHYLLCAPDRGKGDAIRQGISRCSRAIIAQIDADLQFYPEELPKLIQPLLENKADMALGSRFMKTAFRKPGSAPAARSIGNRVISALCALAFGHTISDALAGMKAWKREVTESFTLTRHTYSYEIELFARALAKDWRVMDVPITFELRRHGKSTVPLLKTGLTMVKDILLLRFFPAR